MDLDVWISHKDILQRQFSVMAVNEAEALTLQLSDLNRMKSEFVEAYEKLFENTTFDLKKAFLQRLKAMRICVQREEKDILTYRSGVSMKINEI